jgi:hypothetical protein
MRSDEVAKHIHCPKMRFKVSKELDTELVRSEENKSYGKRAAMNALAFRFGACFSRNM